MLLNPDQLILRVTEVVRSRLENSPGCHDFDHTERVVRNALMLVDRLPQADRTIVWLGALLHDIARPEELSSKGEHCHAELGEPLARTILREAGTPPELIEPVVRCVRRHRYRGSAAPETLEEEIVYDADKLDSLGAVGLGRAFLFAGRCGAKVHNRAEVALAAPAYGPEDTAWREYLVKLRHLPERLLTEPGRAVARERGRFMEDFFRQLEREVFPG